MGITLLRQEGFKLGTPELKEIESALKGLLSLASEGNDAISLFPKYGSLEVLRGEILLKEQPPELILARIEKYTAQLLANYQRDKAGAEQASKTPESAQSQEPPKEGDLWLAQPVETSLESRSEARSEKDYSKMTLDELLRELDQIEGSSGAANGARWAIAEALRVTAQRIPEAELPLLNDSLLKALGKIEGLSDAANGARQAIARALQETARRIPQAELYRMSDPLMR